MNMINNWQGIYGQKSVIKILNNIVSSQKIPHAFLFQGADGVGKDFVAIRFAQLLNTTSADQHQDDLINNQIQNLAEPFVKYIFPLPRGKNEIDSSSPTEKLSPDELAIIHEELNKKIKNPYYKISIPRASNIKISSIRDIKKNLSFEYEDVAYRFIIISDAHLMNEEAQNALLKSLEEPPAGVIFILITSSPSLLRETIISRCWNINFQPLSNSDIQNVMTEFFHIDANLAGKIAPFTGGSVKEALELIEHDFEKLVEKTIFILRYSFGRKYHSALEEFSPYLKDNNSDSIKLIIRLIIIWLNDFQKYRFNQNNYFFSGYVETLEKFYKRFPDINVNNTVSKLDKLASIFKNNINLNLIVLNIIFELAVLVAPKK